MCEPTCVFNEVPRSRITKVFKHHLGLPKDTPLAFHPGNTIACTSSQNPEHLLSIQARPRSCCYFIPLASTLQQRLVSRIGGGFGHATGSGLKSLENYQDLKPVCRVTGNTRSYRGMTA